METVAIDNGVLSKIIKVKILPEDYRPKIDSELKEYKKKYRVDGFRPGHVPMSLIKQRYEKDIIYLQINKIVSESLNSFIDENSYKIIGEPIPAKSEVDFMDALLKGGETELNFEIGLQPEIDLEQSFEEVITRYLLDPSEDMIEEEINHLTRKLGTHFQPEISESGDFIYGKFIELDENGKEKENGVVSDSALAIDLIPNPEHRQQFIGLKKDEEITFDIFKTIGNESEIARILNIKKEPVSSLSPNFKLKINTLNRLIKAEINQDFYYKIFGQDVVKTDEEFRAKIKAAITRQYTQYSDEKLQRDLEKHLLNKLNPVLPHEFIKRYLVIEYPEKHTTESVEMEYNKIEKAYQWTIIENAIKRKYEVKIYQDEFDEVVKQFLYNYYSEQGFNIADEQLTDIAKKYMDNKENAKELNNIRENIIEHKIFDAIRSFIKIEDKIRPMDEFTEIFKH
jgi:trigger factor